MWEICCVLNKLGCCWLSKGVILKKYRAVNSKFEAACSYSNGTYQTRKKRKMAAVQDRVECSTWCWLCLTVEQMLKFVWLLLKATKNVGVASNGLVCYLFLLYHENLQNIIVHKIINMKSVSDICDIGHDIELQEMTHEFRWGDLGVFKNDLEFS